MEKPGRSKNLPSSPWAERFPIDLVSFISQNTNHSTLAPFPRIDDPRYYDQVPPFPQEDIPTKNEDIDKLLWCETIQAEFMHGRETWQTAVLNRYLQFSPATGFVSGGHRPVDARVAGLSIPAISPLPQSIYLPGLRTGPTDVRTAEERDFLVYRRERIQVDETKWLPFLRKDRWFDWTQATPPFEKAERIWSVDDPTVWDFLKVVLELVNRILLALIEDKHDGDYWSNLKQIFGDLPEDNENAIVHLSYSAEQMICQKQGQIFNPWQFIIRQTPADWRARLERLLQKLVWTFNDIYPADANNTRRPPVGNYSPFPTMTTIGVRMLETVLGSKLTLAELCSVQVETAVVLVHELMHAIIGARYVDDNYHGNCLDHQRTGPYIPEPFLDGQGIAETGHYMDQLFWGGVLNTDPGGAVKEGAPPLGLCFTEWPWDGYRQQPSVPDSRFMEPGAIITNHHVPLTWASRMLSESFWQDPAYPKKSANFFHRNIIFVSESPNADSGGGPETYNPPQVRDLQSVPNKYPGDVMLVEDWDERRRLWGQFREPWYRDVKHEWLMGPWSHTTERQAFFEFEGAFAKRDLVTCAKAAETLVRTISWFQDANTLVQDLSSRPRVRTQCLWAWHAIGLLMMASIPIQRMRLWQATGLNAYITEHVPSRDAAATGFQDIVYIKKDPEQNRTIYVGPSTFFNFNLEQADINTITQFDYLQRLSSVLELITTSGSPIHARFYNAINRARRTIRAERQHLEDEVPEASIWSITHITIRSDGCKPSEEDVKERLLKYLYLATPLHPLTITVGSKLLILKAASQLVGTDGIIGAEEVAARHDVALTVTLPRN
ncbi:hypothetical protein F4801DRAFT_574791 [Xylaria longipes]|nr:hypothetical protein F4801DRAFT_574791 [Xylaria longipes]